jgi:hypothetical protein
LPECGEIEHTHDIDLLLCVAAPAFRVGSRPRCEPWGCEDSRTVGIVNRVC